MVREAVATTGRRLNACLGRSASRQGSNGRLSLRRRYRAPECLLTDGYYGHKMDIWGVGCVMFEVIALYPLFPGTDEID